VSQMAHHWTDAGAHVGREALIPRARRVQLDVLDRFL